MMRGGLIMMSKGRVRPNGQRTGSGAVLLNVDSPQYDGIQAYNPINLTSGRGLKTDVQKITDKLEKLTLMKPKNIKKNIRVAL
jgi:hypothetical protein